MSFIVPPDAGLGHSRSPGVRFRRRLPPEVTEQLHRAAQLCDELEAAGVELHFDAPGDGDRVRAVLTDADGNEIREVPLRDVVALDV